MATVEEFLFEDANEDAWEEELKFIEAFQQGQRRVVKKLIEDAGLTDAIDIFYDPIAMRYEATITLEDLHYLLARSK